MKLFKKLGAVAKVDLYNAPLDEPLGENIHTSVFPYYNRPGFEIPKTPLKACTVYLKRDGGAAVVASLLLGGPTVETSDGAKRVGTEDTDLGTAIVLALRSSREGEIPNLRDRKRSEWPAYQASGEKTLKQFEKDYVSVTIKGGRTGYEASAIVIHNERAFRFSSSLPPDESIEAMAELAKYIFKTFLELETEPTSLNHYFEYKRKTIAPCTKIVLRGKCFAFAPQDVKASPGLLTRRSALCDFRMDRQRSSVLCLRRDSHQG